MVINVKNDIEMSTFQIIFKGSVNNEKSGWYGLSHLMEHLICKPLDPLQNELQRFNVTFNAYTSNTEIVFYLTGLDEYVNKYKYKMLDLILNYKITEEDLEKEKRIILEEYQESFNSQLYSHFLNLDRKLFNLYGPIGLRSDIENIRIEDCEDYQSKYLSNPSMIINISKDFPFEKELDFIKNVNNIEYSKNENQTINIKSKEDMDKIGDKIPLELMNDFQNNSSILITSDIIKKDFNKLKYTLIMLSDGLNSPLYDIIREKKGLAYYVGAHIEKLSENNAKINIYTETSTDNVDEILISIKDILDNKEEYLTQERFDIIKDNQMVKYKERKIYKHKYVQKYLNSDEWLIEKIIDSITLDDVYYVVDKYLKWDDLHKSVYQTEFK